MKTRVEEYVDTLSLEEKADNIDLIMECLKRERELKEDFAQIKKNVGEYTKKLVSLSIACEKLKSETEKFRDIVADTNEKLTGSEEHKEEREPTKH